MLCQFSGFVSSLQIPHNHYFVLHVRLQNALALCWVSAGSAGLGWAGLLAGGSVGRMWGMEKGVVSEVGGRAAGGTLVWVYMHAWANIWSVLDITKTAEFAAMLLRRLVVHRLCKLVHTRFERERSSHTRLIQVDKQTIRDIFGMMSLKRMASAP